MASFSSPVDPRRRDSLNNLAVSQARSGQNGAGSPLAGATALSTADADADTSAALTLSLDQLSLQSGPPAKSPRASPRSPAIRPNTNISRSPSVASNRPPPRSPLNGRDSRSATPTLLRKASLNSLQSAAGVAPPRRASSVAIMSHSPLRSPSASVSLAVMAPEHEPKPVPTAASIANAHFAAELESHHGDEAGSTAETVVIIHDNCYGHRFSRPRTSRAALSTIVERPERIKACVLGVSLAYVRLGERHAEGAYPIHSRFDPSSIPSIPFRIQKTTRRLSLLSQTVTNVHGTKWMEELKNMCDTAESKLAMNGKELQRPEMDRGPEKEAPQKFHEGDLYLCSESLDALEGALGGVCEAVDAVFKPAGPKRAFVAIRPPGHHCSASYPSGFCWINNVHVGIMHAILSHGLTHAAIIDFDLHHGDGSQAIAWDHNSRGVGLAKNAAWWKKTSIGYFSVHDINSYPCEMGDEEKVKNASLCIDNAHGQNIWNVHLESWSSEAEFWKLYETKYSVLLEKTRTFLKSQTELRALNQNCKAAIFLSAGFDASEWEGSGMQRHNVNVPTGFYARLTRDVTKIAEEEGTSVQGRVISVLEGGYSDRALYSGIFSHISGLAGDDPIPTKDEHFNGLGYEMGNRISVHSRKESLTVKKLAPPYDPAWWHPAELDQFEMAMSMPAVDPKVPRYTTPPTYSSPTQSSSAKVVAVPKVRRSMSGLSAVSNGSTISRAPTPPPPDVPWTVAAHELSKVLIPTERTTTSCTAEDLSAEATRVRRDRQNVLAQSLPVGSVPPMAPPPAPLAAPVGATTRVSLRERKQVKPFGAINEEDERKNRRRTVAGNTVLATDKPTGRSTPSNLGRGRPPGRRLSAASTVASDLPEMEIPIPSVAPSGGPGRPSTSQSIRPESSMSARAGPGGTLAVRKTRVANPAKKDATAPKAAADRLPSRKTTAPIARSPLRSSIQGEASTAGTSTGQAGLTTPVERSSDEMDQLTKSMKKIKIHVVTPAQREARELAKRRAVEGTTPVHAPRQVEVPAIVQTPVEDKMTTQSQASPSPTPSSTVVSSDLLTPQDRPRPTSIPVVELEMPAHEGFFDGKNHQDPSSTLQSPQEEPDTTPDVFIAYQPEGPAPVGLPQTQPLQWVAPNEPATPAPAKRSGRELPVFTASSFIPFGPRPSEVNQQKSDGTVKTEPDVKPVMKNGFWDVPETSTKS